MWQELRAVDATPPAETTIAFGDWAHAGRVFIRRSAAMTFDDGNQLKLCQNHMVDVLDLTVIPRSVELGAPPGDVIVGSYLAIAAQSGYPDEAADFINWFCNDLEAANIFLAELGNPGSRQIQTAVRPLLHPSDQKVLDFLERIGFAIVPPEPRPLGNFDDTYARIYQELITGHRTLNDAVNAFMDEVAFILR
jgi:multiple sugar transport system substrate-binding protein